MKKSRNRRQFFRQSILGLIAYQSIDQSRGKKVLQNQPEKSQKILRYNTLGRTGFKVSDIAFGNPRNHAVIKAALDAGINYLDTGEEYGNGNSERAIGKVINDKDRKSLFINTKLRLKKGDSKENILKRTRKCLDRLNTDYIDCLMIHNANDVEIVSHPGFHAASQQLKAEGRLKHIGITSHGETWWKHNKKLMTETMEKVCYAAAKDGRFDVFLFVYNFLNTETGERILNICREKNIGATLMKINPVHNFHLLQEEIRKLNTQGKEVPQRYKTAIKDFESLEKRIREFASRQNIDNPREISSAAFRFVSKHPGVHTICCAMPSFEELEHWLSLSGSGFSNRDKNKLLVYKKSYGQFYCRHACGICEEKCPQKIPINTIMRYFYYFDCQKREKEAMILYSKVHHKWNKSCRVCSGNCEQNCPHQVPIQRLLELAHHRLTLT